MLFLSPLAYYIQRLLVGLSLMALMLSSASCFADSQAPSSQLQLYVNGHLEAAIPCADAWNAGGHTVVGRSLFGGAPADFVNGLVADVRLYGKALTPAQIKSLYSQGPSLRWQTQAAQVLGSAQWTDAPGSGAASFSGTQGSVDLGSSLINTSRSYTVSAWVMLNTLDGYQTFVSQDGKTISGFFLQKYGDDNKFTLSVRTSDSVDAPDVRVESSFVPQAHVLYHVVGVYKRGTNPMAASAPAPLVTSTVSAAWVPWDAPNQGQFIESLVQDHQGRTWVAVEDQGVWCYDPNAPAAPRYTHFTAKDGLGSDDVYALLVDKKDRLWAGTLRGVSVYNGKDWKNYGPTEGIGGFRVFAMASCPTTGDVWIATEGGLTRYLLAQDRWKQYGRMDGLPSDAVQALAFNRDGDIFVGTQADGIAMATAQSGYSTWKVMRGPLTPPHAPSGSGLPTSLINCLLVTKAGILYAGTTAGLAHSADGGRTWRFLRGADWSAKADGEHPQNWLDEGLTDQADVRAIEVLPPKGQPIRISCGGAGTGDWGADRYFDGGQTFHTDNPIDDSGLPRLAPQGVYQNARFGSFTYTISHLPLGASCRVRLFLAEVAYDKPGLRVFNVGLNGKRVLTHEDIFQDAGAKNRVILKEFVAQADSSGHLTITFRGGAPLFTSTGHSPYELAEDYVTSLVEDGAGHILVGHRQQGLEVRDEGTGKRLYPGPKDPQVADFVTSLLPQPDGTLLLGGYGAGLKQLLNFGGTGDQTPANTASPETSTLPMPAAPPTLVELNTMLKTVSAVAPDKEELAPKVAALQDDWLTEGDWLGRYGRYWACLNAVCAPKDYLWGAGWQMVKSSSRIGLNVEHGDTLRHYVTWLYTQNPRVLEMPPTYLDSRIKKGLTTPDKNRREAESDDHGETYPQTIDGPNIYETLTVPRGLFSLSLYDFNKDAHTDDNRFRDYRISVRAHTSVHLHDISGFSFQPELAHGRIRDFWGGVWKRFLVRGPLTVTAELNRNHSFNAVLPALMLDLVDENPPPYFSTINTWQDRQTQSEKLRQQALLRGSVASFVPASTSAEAAERLMSTLDAAQGFNSSWWAANSREFYLPLLRWYVHNISHTQESSRSELMRSLATCYYQMGQYAAWEDIQQAEGLTTARQVEKSLRWDGTTGAGQDRLVVGKYLSRVSTPAKLDGP